MSTQSVQSRPQGKANVKAKKTKGTTESSAIGRCFKGSDVFHRMNFLAQVQEVICSESPTASNLHSFYGYTLQLLSRRTQSKLHSSLKRVLCKRCSAPLRPGSNSVKVRTRGKKACRYTVVTCLICGTIKRFPNIEKGPISRMKTEEITEAAVQHTSTKTTKDIRDAQVSPRLPPISGKSSCTEIQ